MVSLFICFLFLTYNIFSSPTYCNKEESKFYCTIARPLDTRNVINQNDIDTNSTATRSNAWHIDTTIYLSNGHWEPGLSTLPWFPWPIIYIEGNGKLIIENNGNTEVAIRSMIFICDNGEFRISNSKFRADMDYGFQFFLWAQDNAKLTITDSTVAMGKASIDGHWLNYIRMNASCYVNNMTGIDGVWEFATLDNATSNVVNTYALTEMYISQQAQLFVTNMQLMDIFFALCPSQTPITLENLPPVGNDITLSVTQNNGFTFEATNTHIFAFACELYVGSNVIFNNIPQASNFALGLNIDNATQKDYNITMFVGGPPVFDGFQSIYNTVFNNAYVFAYMLWMNNINVNIMSGTEVGDIYATENSDVYGKELKMINGNNRVQSNSVTIIDDSEINTFSVVLSGGYLVLRNCTFPNVGDDHIQNNGGYVWFVDNIGMSYPQNIWIENNGKHFDVDITNIAYKSHIVVDKENGIGVVGNIIEMNNNAFDCDVKLVYNANNYVFLTNKITSNVVNDLLLSGGINTATTGEYTIVITFNIGNKKIDVLKRYITITTSGATDSPTKLPSNAPSSNPTYDTTNTTMYPTKTETTPANDSPEAGIIFKTVVSFVTVVCYVFLVL